MEGNLESQRAEPILVARFRDIRGKPETSPGLNDFSNIFEDQERRQHFFEEVRKSFEFIFNKEKFIDHIEREPNKESFAYLKQVRRYGLILKAAYRFVDVNHQCGEDLNQVLSLLGQYNDHYWLSPPADIKEQIKSHLNQIELSVNFADTQTFKEYARNILSGIETLVQKKKLPINQFHDLRKKIRLFSNLLQVAAAEDYGGKLHGLFYALVELSTKLGNQHDDLVQKGLRGEIDYHQSIVKLNPSVADRFKRIRPMVERVCGLA